MIAHVTRGMGFDLYPLQNLESKKQYYYSGGVADSFHARSHPSVALCRKRRDRQDGRAKGITIPCSSVTFL